MKASMRGFCPRFSKTWDNFFFYAAYFLWQNPLLHIKRPKNCLNTYLMLFLYYFLIFNIVIKTINIVFHATIFFL
jgi:hypothetical protein